MLAELGVPGAVMQDQHGFVRTYMFLWKEQDVAIAVPIVKQATKQCPTLRTCSFDRANLSLNSSWSAPRRLVYPEKRRAADADLTLDANARDGNLCLAGGLRAVLSNTIQSLQRRENAGSHGNGQARAGSHGDTL